MAFRRLWAQSYSIPRPLLTEKNLLDQKGRVFAVTGGYAGCGFELSKILYQRNGTVYVAGRSKSNADAAIKRIQTAFPGSKGTLHFLSIDLADSTTVKPAVEESLSKEERLDVLTNNAGVMFPPAGSRSKQDYELQIATNCLSPFLFTKLLAPSMRKTAALPNAPAESVSVPWAGSLGVDTFRPQGGVTLDSKGSYIADAKDSNNTNYGATKTGNYFLASQLASRYGDSGIISNA